MSALDDAEPVGCRCHDPAVFGHTDKNCRQALSQGSDTDWRILPFLHVPRPRGDPHGMTWTGNTWTRTADLQVETS